jgi:hypothetical protein
MMRVGVRPARGLLLGAFVLLPGLLHPSTPTPLDRALDRVRSQDFSPLLSLAGDRARAPFDAARQEAFLEEIFSLGGKWKAMTRGRDSYVRYVRKSFERNVLGSEDLDTLTAELRTDFAWAVAASENRLLGAVYEDLRLQRPDLSFEGFRAEYGRLAEHLAPHVARDVGMNAVAFAGSEAAVALSLAALASTGVLGGSVTAGAAAGPWTFGISLAVGIIAGVALDGVVGEAFEDAARAEIRAGVNEMRNRLIDGVLRSLAQAVDALLALQEACVREAFREARDDEGLARRP